MRDKNVLPVLGAMAAKTSKNLNSILYLQKENVFIKCMELKLPLKNFIKSNYFAFDYKKEVAEKGMKYVENVT